MGSKEMGFKFFKESICTAFFMNGDYVHFLWLLKQMTTNWVAYNSIYLFSYSSGRLKSNMGFSGLKSRCQQGPHYIWRLQGKIISLAFPASVRCLHGLARGLESRCLFSASFHYHMTFFFSVFKSPFAYNLLFLFYLFYFYVISPSSGQESPALLT